MRLNLHWMAVLINQIKHELNTALFSYECIISDKKSVSISCNNIYKINVFFIRIKPGYKPLVMIWIMIIYSTFDYIASSSLRDHGLLNIPDMWYIHVYVITPLSYI